MDQYEYKTKLIGTTQDDQDILNKYGQDGWEIVQAIPSNYSAYIPHIFKRRVSIWKQLTERWQ